MNSSNTKLFTIIFLMGAMSSIMITLNSILAVYVGLALSGLVVHIVGLTLALILFYIYDRKMLSQWPQVFKKEKYLFAGGLLGAAALIASAFCINEVGVFVTTMATIAGQFILSFIIDRKGYFGFEKAGLTVRKLISIAAIAVGIVMISI